MPTARWTDIADDDQAAGSGVARWNDVASVDAAPQNVARLSDIASIDAPPPPPNPLAGLEAALKPVASHGVTPTRPSTPVPVPFGPQAIYGGSAPVVPWQGDTVLDELRRGGGRVAAGAKQLAKWEPGTRLNAANDIVEGGVDALRTPMVIAGALNPIEGAAALAASTGASKATSEFGRAVGARPDLTRLASNVAGLAVGGREAVGGVRNLLDTLRGASEAPHVAPVESVRPDAPTVPSNDVAGTAEIHRQSGPGVARVDDIASIDAPPVAPPSDVAPSAPGIAHVDDIASIEPPPARVDDLPPNVTRMKPADVKVDPERFQFKGQTNVAGVTPGDQIAGPWNENLSGVLLGWKDPADGQTYVVNGHHRLEAATRLNAPDVLVRHIEAASPDDARVVGAMNNIAEGHGSPVDVAKVLRSNGMDDASLAAAGVDPRKKLAKDGAALAQLSDPLFQRVATGDLPEDVGAAIGGRGLTPEDQSAVVTLIERQAAKGRELTARQVSALIDDVQAAPKVTKTTDQPDIFSTLLGEDRAQSVAVEKAVLRDWLQTTLGKDKRLFGFVAKGDRAERLAAAGNVIDRETSAAHAQDAAQVADVVDRLAQSSGPISAALTDAATRVAAGEPTHAVRSQLLEAVRTAVAGELRQSPEGAHPPGSPEPDLRGDAAARRPEAPVDSRPAGDAHGAVAPLRPNFARSPAIAESRRLLDLAQSDRLPTGELQPRLPGDVGAVRDQEVAQPKLDLPKPDPGAFELRPQDRRGVGAKQGGLFNLEPGAESSALPHVKRGPALTVTARGLAFVDRAVPEGVRASAKEISSAIDAPSATPGATRAADILRNAKARIANLGAIEEFQSREHSKFFERRSDADNIANVSHYERTGQFKDAPDGYSEKYRQSSEDALALLHEAYGVRADGPGAETYVEHYVRRAFKFGNAADEAKSTGALLPMVRRSLSANKSPLKGRVLDMPLDEALANMRARGIKVEPVTTNPEQLRQWSIANARQAMAYREAWDGLKAEGLVKSVRAYDDPPDGMVPLTDRAAKIFGPPTVTVKEAFDRGAMDALQQVAANLGVSTERLPQLKVLGGGVPRNAWGVSLPGQHAVQTKFGGPLDVLAHEIGHQMDEKFGLGRQTHEGRLFGGADLSRELQDLSALRFEGIGDRVTDSFKAYVRSREETIATMVQAYVHIPERMQEVAPRVFDFMEHLIDAHDELQPLRAARRGSLLMSSNEAQVYAGGFVQKEQYYADPAVARILDRAISTGLENSPTYRAVRAVNNAANAVQLALSAFHLSVTALNSSITDLALGVRQVARGATSINLADLGRGAKRIVRSATVVGSFIGDVAEGRRLENDLRANAPEAMRVLEAKLNPGGARLGQTAEYKGGSLKTIREAWANKNVFKGAYAVPAAIMHKVSAPLMEYAIPRVKLAAYLHLAEDVTRRMPDAAPDQLHREYAKAWDSIDNRFGQLVYDNLFWNKTAKDLSHLAVRSVGWSLGTVRELGGGAVDVLDAVRGRGVSDRLVYAAVALPVYTWMLGAIIQKAHTGQWPTSLEDGFYPKNGETDASGNPVRMSLPTYFKEAVSWGHDASATMASKASPLLSTFLELARNEDYFGDLIRDPKAPASKQLEQVGQHLLEQFKPMSFDRMSRLTSEDDDPKRRAMHELEAMLGLSPAPSWITKSSAQRQAEELLDEQLGTRHRTPDERGRDDLKRQARDEIRRRRPRTLEDAAKASPTLQRLLREGAFKDRAAAQRFFDTAGLTPMQRELKMLSLKDRAAVLETLKGSTR